MTRETLTEEHASNSIAAPADLAICRQIGDFQISLATELYGLALAIFLTILNKVDKLYVLKYQRSLTQLRLHSCAWRYSSQSFFSDDVGARARVPRYSIVLRQVHFVNAGARAVLPLRDSRIPPATV